MCWGVIYDSHQSIHSFWLDLREVGETQDVNI